MKCGYGKAEYTPGPGLYLQGNPTVRIAQGAADPLNVRCVAFEQNGLALVLVYDLVHVSDRITDRIRAAVGQAAGCGADGVLVCATHTHTAPNVDSSDFPIDQAFVDSLVTRGVEAAQAAVADLRPAKMFAARTEVPGLAFVRRYRMKDGTVRTNPGIGNPDILEPMTLPDESLRAVKVTREGAGDIVLVNFQVHPDIVKRGMPAPLYSADYPGMLCDTVEKVIPGSRCIFLLGAAGNLNGGNAIYPRMCDTGMEQGLFVARALASAVLSVYGRAVPLADGPVKTVILPVSLPLRRDSPEALAHARQVDEWFRTGQKDKFKDCPTVMEYYTAIYEAKNQLAAARKGGRDDVLVSGLAAGGFSMVGIPGEPFCEIGQQIRAASPFAMQFTLGLTNGSHGYFPMKDAFEVNGYESRTSMFQPGIGERFVEAGIEVARRLKDKN